MPVSKSNKVKHQFKKLNIEKGGMSHSQNNYQSNYFVAQSNYSDLNFEESWLFDTAGTHHFSQNIKLFENCQRVNEKIYVAVDGMPFPISGRGNVRIMLNNHEYIFKNALYSPKLKRNLISGAMLDKESAQFNCKGGKLKVISKDESYVFAHFEKWCLPCFS